MLQWIKPCCKNTLYESFATIKERSQNKFLASLAIINEGEKILHISCGDGSLIRWLEEKYQCSISGTTSLHESICAMKLAIPKADVVYCHTEDIPWCDETFSVLLCSHLLSNISDPGKMLASMMRVLKPGGQILIPITYSIFAPLHCSAHYFRSYSKLSYLRCKAMMLLEETGFDTVTWHNHGLSGAAVVGWKPCSAMC